MHLHLSVADSTGKVIGGHLLDENLVYTTIELVVTDLTDLEFTRATDSTYGYPELVIKKKQKP
jgi:predicted DNA-binding protein with PD1-like motif